MCIRDRLLSEREYAHAADILAGHTEKEPLLKELGGWFKDTFGMEVYDYFCGFTNAGRIRLKLVLWDGASRRKMMKGANPDFRKQERDVYKRQHQFLQQILRRLVKR